MIIIMIVFVLLYTLLLPFPPYYKGEFMYGSYISSRMLNTFSYGSNLHIKDKRPAPNLSVIRKYMIILCHKLVLVITMSCAHVKVSISAWVQ